MSKIELSEFLADPTSIIASTQVSGEATVIVDELGDEVVLISSADYRSLQETAHLLQNPRNTAVLREAMDELNRGSGVFIAPEDLG